MSNSKMVNDLFKYLQEGVTLKNLQDSTDKAYRMNESSLQGYMPDGVTYEDIVRVFGEPNGKTDGYKVDAEWEGNIDGMGFTIYNYKTGKNYLKNAGKEVNELVGDDWHIGGDSEGVVPLVIAKLQGTKESKLPVDPSLVKDPDGDIQKLAEEKEAKGDVDPAEETDDNKKSAIEKEMDKATPDVDKKSEERIPNKNDVKNKDMKVDGVEKVKEAKKGECGGTPKVGKAGDEKQEGINKEKVKEAKEKDTKMTVKELAKELGVSVDIVNRIKKELAEGKMPNDPSLVADPIGDIQKLAEEKVLTTVSDETVARDLLSKYPGSRMIADDVDGKKQYIIMVKESINESKIPKGWAMETTGLELFNEGHREDGYAKECLTYFTAPMEGWDKEHEDSVSIFKVYEGGEDDYIVEISTAFGDTTEEGPFKTYEQALGKAIKMMVEIKKDWDLDESKIAEEVTVAVQTDDKEVEIVAGDGVTTVTTTDAIVDVPVEIPGEVIVDEPIEAPIEEPIEDEMVYNDEDALEMAEKVYLVDYLKTKEQLSEKETAFIAEVEGTKLSEANQIKVDEKLTEMKKENK